MSVYYEVVNEIKKLNKEDPEWEDTVASMIKKAIHKEKFHIYHNVFLDLKYGPRRPRMFKKHVKHMVENWIKPKIETHKKFKEMPYTKQMYGLFDWKKNK